MLQRRKNIRLAEYDYSQAGCYFITICTKDKTKILWTDAVGAGIARPSSPCNHGVEYTLSTIGEIIKAAIENIPKFYPSTIVDKYVIMPNHVHMILTLSEVCSELGRTMPAPTISRIIDQLKGAVSKQAGYSVWQKSFYEHVILSEKRYQEIWQYHRG